jgi:hypothetical protein
MKNNWINKINVREYFMESIVDIGVGLLIYKLFGFQITIIVMIGEVMSDVARIYKIMLSNQK